MATNPADLPNQDKVLAAVVCDLFPDYSERHHAPGTFGNYRLFRRSFCLACGRVAASEVRPIRVTRWLDAHPGWKGRRRHAAIAVKRAFSWAEQQGVLVANPLRTLKAGRAERRTQTPRPGRA